MIFYQAVIGFILAAIGILVFKNTRERIKNTFLGDRRYALREFGSAVLAAGGLVVLILGNGGPLGDYRLYAILSLLLFAICIYAEEMANGICPIPTESEYPVTAAKWRRNKN